MVQRLLLRRCGGCGEVHGAVRRRKIRSDAKREGEQLDAMAEVSFWGELSEAKPYDFIRHRDSGGRGTTPKGWWRGRRPRGNARVFVISRHLCSLAFSCEENLL